MHGKSGNKSRGSKSKNYLSKENLVSEVGARWWYVLPEWPPKDYDYTQALATHALRAVPADRFNFEPETDDKGFKKVCEVEAYPGVFQDVKGK